METNNTQPKRRRSGLAQLALLVALTGSLVLTGKAAQDQPEDGRYYRIQNVNSSLYLGVNGKIENGADVMQVNLSKNAPGQQWRFVKIGKYYQIINKLSNKCIDVKDSSSDIKNPVVQWDAHPNRRNQQWELRRFNGHFNIVARHSGMAIGIIDQSKEKGAEVVQLPARKTRNQAFDIIPVED